MPNKDSAIIWLEKTVKGKTTLGVSKMGGEPDLPKLVPWPSYQTSSLSYNLEKNEMKKRDKVVPLRFIAQIACSDLPSTLIGEGFPDEGRLYFFVEEDDEANSDDMPKDRCRVLYSKTSAPSLARRKAPKIPDAPLRSMYAGEERMMRFTLLSETSELNVFEGRNRIGGSASWVQGSGFSSPKEEAEWTLLLEAERDDGGVIYFFVPSIDFKKCDMSRVRCFSQFN